MSRRVPASGGRYLTLTSSPATRPSQPGVIVVSAESGDSNLGVRRPSELPEILQPAQQNRLVSAAKKWIALGRGALQPDFVSSTGE